MTSEERASLGQAPELAVLDVLRAAAEASCAALAVAHPNIEHGSEGPEHDLATQIYAAILQLDRAIAAYFASVLASCRADDDVNF
jgi:hypothetical protein